MNKGQISVAKEKFGNHLQRIREKKNLSLLDVSYNCGIDNSKISKIEHGKFNITLSTILELAKGLDVPPYELLKFEFD